MKQPFEHYFRILDLEPGATLEEIKEAWRTLSQVWHPDKHPTGSKPHSLAVKKQKELNEAYDILKNECASVAKAAINPIEERALRGFVDAQYQLAGMYETGSGVVTDHVQAARWYKEAATQKHAKAQFKLGLLYSAGKGVDASYEQARFWWSKAAEQGNVAAQFNLGLVFEKGLGTKRDLKEAISWFSKAAKSGDTDAKLRLTNLESLLSQVEAASDSEDAWWLGGQTVSKAVSKPAVQKKVDEYPDRNEEELWFVTKASSAETCLREDSAANKESSETKDQEPEMWYQSEVSRREVTVSKWAREDAVEQEKASSAKATDDLREEKLTIQWDKWRNDLLYAVVMKVGERLNDPNEGFKWDGRCRQFVSLYPLGTTAGFSFEVTSDRKIINTTILGASGFKKFDQLVLKGIEDLQGTELLGFPTGSKREVVSQFGSVELGERFDFKYAEYGDVEQQTVMRKSSDKDSRSSTETSVARERDRKLR